jgi:hypothetical protein
VEAEASKKGISGFQSAKAVVREGESALPIPIPTRASTRGPGARGWGTCRWRSTIIGARRAVALAAQQNRGTRRAREPRPLTSGSTAKQPALRRETSKRTGPSRRSQGPTRSVKKPIRGSSTRNRT